MQRLIRTRLTTVKFLTNHLLAKALTEKFLES